MSQSSNTRKTSSPKEHVQVENLFVRQDENWSKIFQILFFGKFSAFSFRRFEYFKKKSSDFCFSGAVRKN